MIIKEHCQNHIILRLNSHSKRLSSILSLVDEARKDFDIKLDEVEIVHYGGIPYRGTMGIEFDTTQVIPADYVEVSQVELTL